MGNVTAKLKGRWRKPVTQQRIEMSKKRKPKHPNSQRSKVSALGYNGYIKNRSIHEKAHMPSDYASLGYARGYATSKGFQWLETAHKAKLKEIIDATGNQVLFGLRDAQEEIMTRLYSYAIKNWPVLTGNLLTSVFSAVYANNQAWSVRSFKNMFHLKLPRSKKLSRGKGVKNGYHRAYYYWDKRKVYSFPDEKTINTTGNFAYYDAAKMIDDAKNEVPDLWRNGGERRHRKQYALKIVTGAEYAEYYNEFNHAFDEVGDIVSLVNKKIRSRMIGMFNNKK